MQNVTSHIFLQQEWKPRNICSALASVRLGILICTTIELGNLSQIL